jgi:PIN domain nuclease of toxin-antitoxin system
MRLLLDTHVFLWWTAEDTRLPKRVSALMTNIEHQLFFSSASAWEIAVKVNLGKLRLSSELDLFVIEQLTNNAISPLPIQIHHALRVATLPLLHRDPFDRMLVAQSLVENMPILTGDSQISRYPVATIW